MVEGEFRGSDPKLTPAEEILAEALDRILDGEPVDLDALPEEFPERAAEIRRRIPALRMLLASTPPPVRPPGTALPAGYARRESLGDGDRGLLILRGDPGVGRLARLFDFEHPALLRVWRLSDREVMIERIVAPTLADGLSGETGDSIVRRFATLAQGLSLLHERGYVHGGLMPELVRVVPERGLVLTDPGGPDLPGKGERLRFTAPELLRDPGGEPTVAADRFSLGAMLFAALTGAGPSRESSAAGILAEMEKDWPPEVRDRNPDISEGHAQLVSRCLSRSPADRPNLSAYL